MGNCCIYITGNAISVWEAIRTGQLKVVQVQIGRWNVNSVRSKFHSSLLISAVSAGKLDIVEYLCSIGANINHKDPSTGGATALYCAASKGRLDIIKYLHEHGADVTTSNDAGWTPMHIAAAYGYLNIVMYLFESGACLHKRTTSGVTPIGNAVVWDRLCIVEYLLKSGADACDTVDNMSGNSLLHEAVKYGYASVAMALVHNGADIHARNWSDLSCIDFCKDPVLVKELLWIRRKPLITFLYSAQIFGFEEPHIPPSFLFQNIQNSADQAVKKVIGNNDLLRIILHRT